MEDLDSVKDRPEFKVIMKTIIKKQIQVLIEELAQHAKEETVILTASISDGSISHLGSNSGKKFLKNNEEIKTSFLSFCLNDNIPEPVPQELAPVNTTISTASSVNRSPAKKPNSQRLAPYPVILFGSGHTPTPSLVHTPPANPVATETSTDVRSVASTTQPGTSSMLDIKQEWSDTDDEDSVHSGQNVTMTTQSDLQGSNMDSLVNRTIVKQEPVFFDDEEVMLAAYSQPTTSIENVEGETNSDFTPEVYSDICDEMSGDSEAYNASYNEGSTGFSSIKKKGKRPASTDLILKQGKAKLAKTAGQDVKEISVAETSSVTDKTDVSLNVTDKTDTSLKVTDKTDTSLKVTDKTETSLRVTDQMDASFKVARTPETDTDPVMLDPSSTSDGKSRQSYLCKQCPYSSFNRTNVSRHTQAVHFKQKFQCDECSHHYSCQYDLSEHIRSKHQNMNFLCEFCSKSFLSRKTLSWHKIRKHSSDHKYVCEFCSKTLNDKAHYLGHVNNHLKSKPYVCSTCSRSYSYKTSLSRHSLLCKGNENEIEKLHQCSQCDSVFSSAGTLHDHEMGKHGQNSLICSCGKTFAWRSSLVRHKRKCKDFFKAQEEM